MLKGHQLRLMAFFYLLMYTPLLRKNALKCGAGCVTVLIPLNPSQMDNLILFNKSQRLFIIRILFYKQKYILYLSRTHRYAISPQADLLLTILFT